MAKTLKQPTDRRGMAKIADTLDGLSRRERIAALTLAILLVALLAAGVGSAVGGGLPFGDDDETRGSAGLPSDWSGLEPLLPLAPSLKDIADLKGTAAGEASGVLATESGGGRALRLRALPQGADAARLGRGARVVRAQTPTGRPGPAVLRAPRVLRVPSVRRILATRVGAVLGATNELLALLENDLRDLSELPIDVDLLRLDLLRLGLLRLDPFPDGISLPPIGEPVVDPPDSPGDNPLPGSPLPGGGAIPTLPGGSTPINVTVVDSQADSSFDVLLVARGRRLVEAYRFRDQDVAGLAAQINLRSSVLVADALRDGRRLARVTAASLRTTDTAAPLGSAGSAAPGAQSGTTAVGPGPAAAGASRGGTGGDRGLSGLAGSDTTARSRSTRAKRAGAKAPPSGRSRRSRLSGGGSAAGRRSSPRRTSSPRSSPRSGAAANTPRRARTGRSTRSPRTSPGPRRRSSRPPRRSSPRAGHGRGRSRKKPKEERGSGSRRHHGDDGDRGKEVDDDGGDDD